MAERENEYEIPPCPNTSQGEPCLLGADHEPPLHKDAAGNTWPMHLPYVAEPSVADLRAEIESLIAHSRVQSQTIVMLSRLVGSSPVSEIDRSARAYGWEIGKGRALTDVVDCSDDNPFLDPDWRERMLD